MRTDGSKREGEEAGGSLRLNYSTRKDRLAHDHLLAYEPFFTQALFLRIHAPLTFVSESNSYLLLLFTLAREDGRYYTLLYIYITSCNLNFTL